MWFRGLRVELFGCGPWPGSLGFAALRDGHVLCTGTLQTSRTTGCTKFLAALKHHMLHTTAHMEDHNLHTHKTKRWTTTQWQLPAMQQRYQQHQKWRRNASTCYEWETSRCHPQTQVGERPRCPQLWAAECEPPLAGIELLEGAIHHLQVALFFPTGCTPPRAQEVLCYYRPLYHDADWRTTPHWACLWPELMHYQRLHHESGAQVMVIGWMGPERTDVRQPIAHAHPYAPGNLVVQPAPDPVRFCIAKEMFERKYWTKVFGR